MMKTKCIVCGVNGKTGLRFNGLQGEPFFCERCLFLILMGYKLDALTEYCNKLVPKDAKLPRLHPDNIWKEGV